MCVRNLPQFLAYCEGSLLALSSVLHVPFAMLYLLCGKYHARHVSVVFFHTWGSVFQAMADWKQSIRERTCSGRHVNAIHLPDVYPSSPCARPTAGCTAKFIPDPAHSRYSMKISLSPNTWSVPS